MAVAVSAALGLAATTAYADPVIFNPHDGGASFTIGGLDWGTTTFLGQGAQNAIGEFALTGGTCPFTGCIFNVLTQANLTAFTDPDGDALLGTRLGVNYSITMIAKFQERVTSISGTTANFATVTSGPTLVEIYIDPIPGGTASNQTSGFGFNDGRLIFKATSVGASTGNFTVTPGAPVNLDQNGAQNYAGQLSVAGTGSNLPIAVGGITQDFGYFVTKLADMGLNFSNIGQSLPFTNINPMDCFTDVAANTTVGTSNAAYACNTAHANAPYSGQGAALPGGYIPVVGPVNGLFGSGAPDFVAQTDFNSGLTAVPEPTSLALLGLGLGAFGFGVSRRRRTAA